MTYNELQHHGILGMKWGVRRYQNYDGTYTQKGLERYKKSEDKYNKAKQALKNGSGTRIEVREAKREMSKNYDRLAKDKRADQGKALYQQGKTITSNNNKLFTAGKIAAGTATASTLLAAYGKYELAAATTLIGMGMSFVNGILGIKAESENKKLRAYYAHGR